MKLSLCILGAAALAGCSPTYAPDTYSTRAVQQVNKVEPGIVVGFRQVLITASGTVGAVTGGAAGGVLGARAGSSYGFDSALAAVGGTAVGGLVGTTIEHATADTTGWEYIVRKDNGEMVSVTQREETPLQLGQKVLVIGGAQARIVPDYSEPIPTATAQTPVEEKPAPAKSRRSASRPSFPLLVVPLSSESTFTSAPEVQVPTPPVPVVTTDAAPAEAPNETQAPAEAPTAAIADTISEPIPASAPAEKPAEPIPAAAPAETPQPTEAAPEPKS